MIQIPNLLITSITLVTFLLFISSCSNGKIDYNNRAPSCLEIMYPEYDDTLGIPSDEKLVELKKLNSNLFDNIRTATLSNASKSKIISFTVKVEANKGLPNSTSQTQIIKLNPGEQKELGCTKTISYIIDKEEKTIRLDTLDVTMFTYSVVGEVIQKK